LAGGFFSFKTGIPGGFDCRMLKTDTYTSIECELPL